MGCTVTDGGGLSAGGSFSVTVAATTAPALTLPATLSVTTTDLAGATVACRSRSEIFADGIEQTQGAAGLAVSGCGGRPAAELPMTFEDGRWVALLDTGRLGAPGCYEVTATLDGHAAGSFRIELRSATPIRARR